MAIARNDDQERAAQNRAPVEDEDIIVPELEEHVGSGVVPWSDRELATLRKYYAAGVPTKKLAEYFGRTIGAVRSQVNRNGYSRG